MLQNEDDSEECDKPCRTEAEEAMKRAYHASCDDLGAKVGSLEDLQVEILKLLLINDDAGQVSTVAIGT